MFTNKKNGRRIQQSKASVAAEQFEERKLLTAAFVDPAWFAPVSATDLSAQSSPDYLVQLQDGFASSPAVAQQKLAASGVRVLSGLGARGAVVVSFSGSLQALQQVAGVASASPNAEMKVTSAIDPLTGSLWGHDKINAPAAWTRVDGAAGTVVAVLDTGIDSSHPDLSSAIFRNARETAGNGIDDDRNGFVDDVSGYDFFNLDSLPADDHGHGTHVSGTIAAVVNGSGMQGIAYGAKVLPLKILGSNGRGSTAFAIRAVNYVTLMRQRGTNITAINASFGGGGFSQPFVDAIRAAGEQGIVFVAAAGNDSHDNGDIPFYPASYDLPCIVSVGATTENDSLASFSNYGSTVDIAAPGSGILSTVPGGRYETWNGTSMAAPHVAAAIAMIKAVKPQLTMNQAIDSLFSSADVIAGLNVKGGRRLNLAKAVGAAPTVPAPTAPGNLRVTDIWQKAADVRWDDARNETSYRVELAEGSGPYRKITDLSAETTRYRFTELQPGRQYSVRITALNAKGAAASEIQFKTTNTPPTAPIGLRTTNIWSTKADITWTLTSQNESQVRIWQMNSQGQWQRVSTVAAGTTTFRLTGLLANSQNRVRVSVWNTGGEAFSYEFTFRTPK